MKTGEEHSPVSELKLNIKLNVNHSIILDKDYQSLTYAFINLQQKYATHLPGIIHLHC